MAAIEPLATPESVGLEDTLRSRWRHAGYLGFAPLGLLIIVALIGPVFARFDPERAYPLEALLPPGGEHWFGTNNTGGDVFTRVVFAARLDLFIALVSVFGAFVIATPLGAVVGYTTRWWGALVMRIMDFLQSFPIFVLAMAFVAVTGANVKNVVLVIGILNVPIFVRLVRAEVLSIRQSQFVEAARVVGNSDARLILRHILPNAIGSSLAQASISVGWALLLTAGLSFVGAGLQPPTAEWGLMIAEGAENMTTGEWWIAVFPGIALGLAVLCFAVAGDAIRALVDVRRRSS